MKIPDLECNGSFLVSVFKVAANAWACGHKRRHLPRFYPVSDNEYAKNGETRKKYY